MNSDPFSALIAVLDAWQAEGRVARFWLRDDDAIAPSSALSRLADLCARHAVPAVLAVIPAHVENRLADFVSDRTDLGVVVHGWSHVNHALPGEKKQELGPHRPAEDVISELHDGVVRLSGLFGARFTPVLVPPWNRIDKALLPRIAEVGLHGLSVFGPEQVGFVPTVNTHADIMDWHGTRGCRPPADIVGDIVRRMGEMQASDATMGLLTHHLVHDEAAWDFLDAMFAATAGHAACRWCDLSELFPQA